MNIVKECQRQGKMKHTGFATHGMSTAIVDVITVAGNVVVVEISVATVKAADGTVTTTTTTETTTTG
eukprot:COSAG02_NODE_181_length_30783_cov_53.060520_10_plen_67_part_00